MITAALARPMLALTLAAALFLAAGCGATDAPATDLAAGSNGDHVGERTPGVAASPAGPGEGSTNGSTSAGDGILDPDERAGLEVYRAQYCGTCHRSGVAGTTGTFGPSHDSLRATAQRRIQDPGYTGSARTVEDYVRESVRQPDAYRVPGFEHTRFQMPAYTQLSEADVNALVRLLLRDPPTDGGRP